MLECIGQIRRYTSGGKPDFVQNDLVKNAVLRVLQVLAESTQRLSGEAKAKEPTVPWPMIAGFRNKLVHDYLGMDDDQVWSIVEKDLPELEAAVNRLLRTL